MKGLNSSKGVLILTFTNICSKLLSLVYIPLLTQTIGNVGYGVYGASYNVYTFVYMVTIAGISTAIPKLIAEYMGSGHERDAVASFKVGRAVSIIMGFVMTALLIIGAKPAASFVKSDEAYLAILALCPSIFITSVMSAYRGYFQGRNKLTPIGISQFIEQALNVFFSVIFSYILMKYSREWGVAGGAFGTTVGALVSLIYLKIVYLKEIKTKRQSKKRLHSNKYLLKYIMRYSFPLIVSTAFIYAGNNVIDLSFIKNGLFSIGMELDMIEIIYGDFLKYMQIINTPMIIITSLSIYILPLISKENASKDKTILRNSIKRLVNLGFLIAMPAAVGMSILSIEIFTVILGSGDLGAAHIMKYGSPVFIVMSVYFLSNTMMNSLGKVKEGAITSFVGVIIKIICDFIFIPIAFFNIYGAVLGLFLSNLVMVIMNMGIIEKYIQKRGVLVKAIIKPTLGALAMGAVIFGGKWFVGGIFKVILGNYIGNLVSLLLLVYIGVFVYVRVMVLIDGIDEEMLNYIPRKMKPFLGINEIIIKEV